METRRTNNRIVFALLYLVILCIVMFAVGQVISYFKTDASDPIFNVDSQLFELAPATTKWLNDDSELNGPINKYVRQEIEESYAKSWQIKNLSTYHQKDLGLKEHFSKPLQVKIKKGISSSILRNETVSETHNLKLHFISLDKQIVSFTDSLSIRHTTITGANTKYSIKDTSNFKVVMTLNDGKWRIKKLHKI